MEAFNIAVKAIFIDNMVFAYFLGMCLADGLGLPVDKKLARHLLQKSVSSTYLSKREYLKLNAQGKLDELSDQVEA